MRARTAVAVFTITLCAGLGACGSEPLTLPSKPPSATSLPDETTPSGGWVGGGGRSDVTTTSISGGWVGGGGFTDVPDSTAQR